MSSVRDRVHIELQSNHSSEEKKPMVMVRKGGRGAKNGMETHKVRQTTNYIYIF